MGLLVATSGWAQSKLPGTPTSIDIYVMPATGDPLTGTPVGSANTVIATQNGTVVTANAQCGKDPMVGPFPPVTTNPKAIEVMPDPFNNAKVCWANVPTGLPNGNGYRVTATFTMPSCIPNGVTVSPCPSAKVLAADAAGTPLLFNLAPIPDRPVAPTRVVGVP